MNIQFINSFCTDTAQGSGFAVGDVVHPTGRQAVAQFLTRQPHRVDCVLIVGHIDHRAAAVRQQHAAVVVHHVRQTGNKHFVVWAKQALWAQHRKPGLRICLGQQADDLFASGFAAGKFIGKAVRAKIFFVSR